MPRRKRTLFPFSGISRKDPSFSELFLIHKVKSHFLNQPTSTCFSNLLKLQSDPYQPLKAQNAAGPEQSLRLPGHS